MPAKNKASWRQFDKDKKGGGGGGGDGTKSKYFFIFILDSIHLQHEYFFL
jgi:hypothetical protein